MSAPMSRLDALEARLRSPEVAALCARLDAEAQAPGYVPPPPPDWLPDPFGPDPFGQDWAWATPQGPSETPSKK